MRISFWDKWKGIAIIAVVLIHATGSTASFPEESLNNNFGIILRQFINFPVGLFIFLAAFFAANPKKDNENYVDSVKKRIWRLTLPFLIWSSVYFAVKLARGSLIISDIPLMLFNGTSVSVGYFVIVMIQMSFISPFLEKLSISTLYKVLPISFVLSLCTTYTLTLILTESIWSKFPYYPLPFIIWLPFYIGGLIVSKKGGGFWKRVKLLPCLVAYIICVLLSLAEAFWVHNDIRTLATSQLKFTSMLTAGAVCLLIISGWKYGKNNKENFLAWLGQRSYYFYLSHMLVLSKAKYFFEKFSVIYDNQIIFVLVIAIATLFITSIGALILDKALSRHRFFRRALGLS